MNVTLFLGDLLKSWKSSLQFFWPPAGKLFFLVGLKTIMQTYITFFKQLWPLIIVAGVAHLAYMLLCIPNTISCFLLWLLAHTLSMLMIFLMLLIIRSSIKEKSFNYYRDYMPHFALLWIISLLFAYFNSSYFLTSPTFLFYMFFIFDTPFDIKNIVLNCWRAFKMVLFGLPFCILIWLVVGIILALLLIVCVLPLLFLLPSNSMAEQVARFIMYLLLPVVYVWYANFYIKRVRDHYSLYF